MPYTAPETADVAALLRSRAVVPEGDLLPDFTTETEPSKVQVEALIGIAAGMVLPGLGSLEADALTGGETCQATVWAGARSLVALGAAMLVEQSYWPEQQGSGDLTVADLMLRLLEGDTFDRVARAAARCRGESGGGDGDTGGGGVPSARWSFPRNAGGMIGHGTRW